MDTVMALARQVKMVIFDVDGVLTDGSLFLGDDGQEYKAFNSQDGHGMAMLQKTGLSIGIITGRSSEVVKTRMHSLGVQHVYQGYRDKIPAFNDLRQQTGLQPEQFAYVGDDVVDLPIMCQVGLAIAVADAHELVIQHAQWRTRAAGGRGAAREVCEMLMAAHGTLQAELDSYLPGT